MRTEQTMKEKLLLLIIVVLSIIVVSLVTAGKVTYVISLVGAFIFLIILMYSPLNGLLLILGLYPIVENRVRIDLGSHIPALSLVRVVPFLILGMVLLRKRNVFVEAFFSRNINPEKLMFMLLLLLIISTLKSEDLIGSVQILLDAFVIPFVFFIFGKILFAGIEERKKFVSVLIFLATYSAIIAIIQKVLNNDLGLGRIYWDGRVSGPFPSAEIFGSTLAMILPLSIYYTPEISGKRRSVKTYIFRNMLIVNGVILSFFRTCWLALILGLFVFLMFTKGRFKKIAKRLFGVSLIAFFIGVAFWEPMRERLLASYSAWDRVFLSETAINMGLHHPWLGVGLGNFRHYYMNYLKTKFLPLDYVSYVKFFAITMKGEIVAHNSYLELFAESGIFAALLFLWILYLFLRRLRWLIKNASFSDPFKDRNWYVVILVMFVGYTVSLLFQSMLYYSQYSNIIFFTMFGLVESDYHTFRE